MSTYVSPPPTVETPTPPETVRERVHRGAASRRQVVVGPQPAQRRANGALLFSLVVALAGTIGLLYIYQTSMVAGLGLELTQLQQRIERESVRNEELSYQLGYYEALPRIEHIAVDNRGMLPQESSVFLRVPRPVDDALPVPTASPVDDRSSLQRALDMLLGRGSADDALVARQ
ncbi:MAG: hypothetical protein DCC58_03355 [Chloroflexi bacterium]|nr:MAG: hypothetical protein DCC58_03355 [Chloroflexota bacterium]